MKAGEVRHNKNCFHKGKLAMDCDKVLVIGARGILFDRFTPKGRALEDKSGRFEDINLSM